MGPINDDDDDGLVVVVVAVVVVVVIVMVVVVMVFLVLVMIVVVMVVVRMDHAVEVLSLTPDESRAYSGLNRQAASVAEAPLKNTTEECIDSVVLGAAFEVGVEAAMTFDGDQWREIEFTGFERFPTTSAMGTVGKSRRCLHQREQQQGQQQGARTEH